jgi:hypothetical protein
MLSNRVTRHLSYSNVMATLGVFIALGGASYAAVALPANSVSAKQLRKNAVTSAKVKDGSLRRGDLASGALQGLQGPQGPVGPQGSVGPKGDTGQNGAPGQQGEPGTARAFAFVDPFSCGAGPSGPCKISKAKNVLGARRLATGDYCVQVAAGIDPATTGSAVGVDFFRSNSPEGNGVAMSDSSSGAGAVGGCLASEFAVETWRVPSSAPTTSGPANDVGFWILVP